MDYDDMVGKLMQLDERLTGVRSCLDDLARRGSEVSRWNKKVLVAFIVLEAIRFLVNYVLLSTL